MDPQAKQYKRISNPRVPKFPNRNRDKRIEIKGNKRIKEIQEIIEKMKQT